MSETDSFIDEVSEEVRRDQLYGVFRKYAWIALGAVVLIVGAAAFNEWRKAQTRAASEAAGDRILEALEIQDSSARVDALTRISFDDAGKQALVKLQEAAMLVEDGRIEEAAAVYEAVSSLDEAGDVYTDLAKLKRIIIQPEAEGVQSLIEELTALDRPFRLMAIEQRALASIRSGDIEAALTDLSAIVLDNLTTQELRERSQQLIVVLGGEVPELPSLLPTNENG